MNELRGTKRSGKPAETVSLPQFASPQDHAECRRLHKHFGTTYFFASRRFPAKVRRRIHALYGFVRLPDEWVDNHGGASATVRIQKLRKYRNEFLRGMDGVNPSFSVLRAFCDVAHEVSLPVEEPLRFLDAMEQDVFVARYDSYEDLRRYMRGSAVSVGLMMCTLLEVPFDDKIRGAASALGEAMQLTNFLRDIGEDIRRGRIYLPLEDLRKFQGSEVSISREEMSPEFVDLMKFEIERARSLYLEADLGIPLLPSRIRPAVRLARILYARILDRIEMRTYDVFTARARTSTAEKIITAFKVLSRIG
jgi:phytoene synthase